MPLHDFGLPRVLTLCKALSTYRCLCIVQVAGFDMQQVNKWQWRPDYEGIHLADCK